MFTRKWLTVFRYLTVFVMLWIIIFTPLQMASQAVDQNTLQELIPAPTQPSGPEVYHAIYRGVKENY